MKDPSEYPSRKAPKFVVRLPKGMKERIRDRAKREGRSMNTQFVLWLEQKLQFEEGGRGVTEASCAPYGSDEDDEAIWEAIKSLPKPARRALLEFVRTLR